MSKIKKMVTNSMIKIGEWLIANGCKLAKNNNQAFGEF